MVPGNSEDRPVIGAKGLEELIVVILRFAEVVDHIAEVEEKRRTAGALVADLGRHGVHHRPFMSDGSGCSLRAVDLGRASIAHGVKLNLSLSLNGSHHVRGNELRQIQGLIVAARRNVLHLVFVRQVIRRVVVRRTGVVLPEFDLIRCELRVGIELSFGTDDVLEHGTSLRFFGPTQGETRQLPRLPALPKLMIGTSLAESTSNRQSWQSLQSWQL